MKLSSKVVYVALGCLLSFLIVAVYLSVQANTDKQEYQFSDTSMHYELVTTPSERERGLSGRAVIPENYGMLFLFGEKDRYGFWMKDMLTPIDIIWLEDDGTITKIDANVSPSTYPTPYYPPVPVRYVLETKANFASKKGWQVGSKIPLPLVPSK